MTSNQIALGRLLEDTRHNKEVEKYQRPASLSQAVSGPLGALGKFLRAIL